MRSPPASGYASDRRSVAVDTDSSSDDQIENPHTCAMDTVPADALAVVASPSDQICSAGAPSSTRASQRPQWRVVALALPAAEAQELLDAGKQTRTTRSHDTNCTVCVKCYPHAMKYKMLACRSSTCAATYPETTCAWRGKVMACPETELTYIYEAGQHLNPAVSPRKGALTAAHKDYCRELVAHGLKPQRVRNALREKFGLRAEHMPSLSTVQGFCNHYAASKLDNHDRFDEILELIRKHAYLNQQDDEPIVFTDSSNETGQLLMGDGTDEHPFVVGVTTTALLRRLDRAPASFVLHVDATFKLSQLGYPVMVIGIPDRCRTFHLVALIIISQQTEHVYGLALAAFRQQYIAITDKPILLRYVMRDAEAAQYNALHTSFGGDSSFLFLMCFFHAMLNTRERLKTLPEAAAKVIRSDIYDMHFCASLTEFQTVAWASVQRWQTLLEANTFSTYFVAQWLTGRFWTWQCFFHPPGYATTNNPVEQFNRVLKREYSLHRKLKMGTLLHQLLKCARDMSESPTQFHDYVEASSMLARRMRHLQRDGLLTVNDEDVQPTDGAVVSVMATPAPRFFVPTAKRTEEYVAVSVQFGTNYARMEILGQPDGGWPVDVSQQFCPCRYHWKFGTCVHLLYAMQVSRHVDGMDRRFLFDRSAPRKGCRKAAATVGRPTNVGPALSME